MNARLRLACGAFIRASFDLASAIFLLLSVIALLQGKQDSAIGLIVVSLGLERVARW